MKVIIAGSRSVTSPSVIIDAINYSGFDIDEVVSGTARGVDRIGEQWGCSNNKKITRFPADWDKHGKSAGYRRNVDMAQYADALIAVWDGSSKGTQHMINIAHENGLEVFIFLVNKDKLKEVLECLRLTEDAIPKSVTLCAVEEAIAIVKEMIGE